MCLYVHVHTHAHAYICRELEGVGQKAVLGLKLHQAMQKSIVMSTGYKIITFPISQWKLSSWSFILLSLLDFHFSYKIQPNTTYCSQSVLDNVAHSVLNMMKWWWSDYWLHVIQAAFPWASCWLLNVTSSYSSIEVKNILSTGLRKNKSQPLKKCYLYMMYIFT